MFLGTGFTHPLRIGTTTSGFGSRKDPFSDTMQFHRGIDIGCPGGSLVHAARDGKVVYTGYRGGYGLLVILQHAHDYYTYYGHLSRILVKNGSTVNMREPIALSGNTGRTTGPHLHFEVRKGGTAVNPVFFQVGYAVNTRESGGFNTVKKAVKLTTVFRIFSRQIHQHKLHLFLLNRLGNFIAHTVREWNREFFVLAGQDQYELVPVETHREIRIRKSCRDHPFTAGKQFRGFCRAVQAVVSLQVFYGEMDKGERYANPLACSNAELYAEGRFNASTNLLPAMSALYSRFPIYYPQNLFQEIPDAFSIGQDVRRKTAVKPFRSEPTLYGSRYNTIIRSVRSQGDWVESKGEHLYPQRLFPRATLSAEGINIPNELAEIPASRSNRQ